LTKELTAGGEALGSRLPVIELIDAAVHQVDLGSNWTGNRELSRATFRVHRSSIFWSDSVVTEYVDNNKGAIARGTGKGSRMKVSNSSNDSSTDHGPVARGCPGR